MLDAANGRAEIIAATARVVIREGPEGLTMRGIAAEAGCTIGRLNHWFGSKDELIAAVLDDAVATAVGRTRRTGAEPEPTLLDTLTEFLPLDAQRDGEFRVWVVFWALAIGRPELQARSAMRVRELRRQLTTLLGQRGVADAAAHADLVMATIDGIAANHLADPEHWTSERQVRVLVQALGAVVQGAVG